MQIEEYEQTLLAILVAHPTLLDTLVVPDYVFFSDDAMKVYSALIEARKYGQKPDIVMISDALHKAGNGSLVVRLASLDPTISGANASYYLDKLLEHARKRELLQTIIALKEGIGDPLTSAEELADRAMESISNAMQKTSAMNVPTLGSLIPAHIDELNRRAMAYRNHTATLMGTGFYNLDELMGAIMPTELVVVAARPGCGKSAFAQHCVNYVSDKLAYPTSLFSLEMDAHSILDRMLASEKVARVRDLREGKLDDETMMNVLQTCEQYRDIPLAIFDNVYSAAQLHSYIRREVANRGVKMVAVDYLGLLGGLGGDSSQARWEKVGEETGTLKRMAVELKIVIMILVQLSREAEGVEPSMSMLRDSGAIEQDADKVLFLYSKQTDEAIANAEVRQILLKVGKNRNGSIGQVPLMFDGAHMRMFVEVPPEKKAPEKAMGQTQEWGKIFNIGGK